MGSAKNINLNDTSFEYKLNLLLSDADSNFINYKSTEINYLHYKSKIELSNFPGNTTIGKEFAFSNWVLTSVFYSGNSQAEAENYFHYYENKLNLIFGNTFFSKKYTTPNNSFPVQTFYSKKTSATSYESSRLHITGYLDKGNLYKVAITIDGGFKSNSSIINPDSTKVNAYFRQVLQYIFTSIYTKKAKENLFGEMMKGSDTNSDEASYKSKYCFEGATCNIINTINGYFFSATYKDISDEKKDVYFNDLYNSIYNSLSNAFVWYKENDDVIDKKSTKIIFAVDVDHIYTNTTHKIVLQKHSSDWKALLGAISITIN